MGLRLAVLLAVASAVLVACGADPIAFVPKNFDHPADVAFVCFDTATNEPHPLADCDGVNDDRESTLALHAVVTQRIRGELAVVDLRKRRLIDANTLVPGYTFVPVGELPNGVVVPPGDPEFTYVADYGSQDIRVIPTKFLRTNLANAELATATLSLGTGPGDLVLSPDGTKLYASLPDTGQIAEIPLEDDGNLGTPTFIALSATVTAPVPAEAATADYCVSCPVKDCETLPMPSAPPVREPIAFGMVPKPVTLFVDETENRLLVSDEALPMVHVLDVSGAATEEAGYATGSPTVDVVVTPAVPDKNGDKPKSAKTRYVYAVDATDGSVMVLDDATGEVLRVNETPGMAPDRVKLAAAARTLAVMAPDYEDGKGDLCTSDNRPLADAVSPTHLRGVFVAVGTANGLTGIIDVYDMDANCRVCSASSSAQETEYYIRRHHVRVGGRIRQTESLFGTPSMVVNSLVFRPDFNGVMTGALAPDLAKIECPMAQRQVFPRVDDGDEPVLCSASDPWTATSERWTATFEGPILGSRGGHGVIDPDAKAVDVETNLCAAGVLGEDNVADLADGEPEAGYGGDLLEITSDLPPATEDDEACVKHFGDGAKDTNRMFPIALAKDHRVTVSVKGGAWDEVRRCFPDPFAYAIRSGDAYTLIGSRTGSIHRVVAEEGSGACVVDTEQDPRRQFRLQYDRLFDNGYVAFELKRPVPENPDDALIRRGDLAYFQFATGNAPVFLYQSVGTLPAKVTWSAIDDYLYVLDNSGRGFLRLVPDDMSVGPTTAFR